MMDYFGVDAPLSSFAYITVNGEDWGLYVAVEDVTDSFLERNYGNDYGELYKPDSTGNMGGGQGGKMQAPEDIGDFTDNKNLDENAGDFQPPTDIEFSPADDTQDTQQAPGGRGGAGGGGGVAMSSDDTLLVYTDDDYDSYSNIFDNAETDITDADKDRLISSLKQLNEGENIDEVVNVDEVIRYFVVHNFVCNFDSYTGSMVHNYYLYEEDGQLSMIPWDYNLAFGGFMGGSDADSLVNYPIDTPVSGLSVEERPMLAWIFSDEEYTELYHAYFAEFISSFFDSGYFEQIMDDVYELISPYVEKDPTKFCTYDEFVTGFNTLKEFCLLRAESITGQLNGTIPSTSEGQQEDPSSLIDASFISITDMGSQGGNMGGGGGRRENVPDMAGTDDATNNTEGTADNMSADIPFPDASTADLPGDASAPADADVESTQTGQEDASQSPENTQAPGGRVNIQSTVSGTDQQNTSLLKTPSDTAGSGQINTGSEQSQEDSAASSDGLNDTAPEDMQNTDMAPGMNRMAQNGAPAESQNSGSTLVLVIVSAVVLAIGILIAALYKK